MQTSHRSRGLPRRPVPSVHPPTCRSVASGSAPVEHGRQVVACSGDRGQAALGGLGQGAAQRYGRIVVAARPGERDRVVFALYPCLEVRGLMIGDDHCMVMPTS